MSESKVLKVENRYYYSGCGCEAHPDFDFCVDCRISELEGRVCPNCDLIEKENGRLRESETYFAEMCGVAELKLLELRAKLEAVEKWADKWGPTDMCQEALTELEAIIKEQEDE